MLGASMTSSYYQSQYQNYQPTHPLTKALTSFAQAPAPPQPLLTHAPEAPAMLRLTDTSNVPGPVASPLPRSELMGELEKWLKDNKIGCNDDILKRMIEFQCEEGADLLLVDPTEWTALGFKGASMVKLAKLKLKA